MHRYNKDIAWRNDFEIYCKQQAMGILDKTTIFNYGNCIYQSPVLNNISWVVNEYNGEYNVFVQKHLSSSRVDRRLAASFGWKESAIEFALKMLLTCGRLISRKGEILQY